MTFEDIITDLITAIGDNPERDGVKDTPRRVVKMYKELFRGYDPTQHPTITTFLNGSDGLVYDEMIIDSGSFTSHCEHHMMPFTGQYWFAYVPHPKGNIIGLSKVARVVDYCSARLQVQERLTTEIVDTIAKALQRRTAGEMTCEIFDPLGVALVMRASHTCKSMRGVKKDGLMTTSCLRGVFKDKPEAREEFMRLIR